MEIRAMPLSKPAIVYIYSSVFLLVCPTFIACAQHSTAYSTEALTAETRSNHFYSKKQKGNRYRESTRGDRFMLFHIRKRNSRLGALAESGSIVDDSVHRFTASDSYHKRRMDAFNLVVCAHERIRPLRRRAWSVLLV